MRIIAGRIRSEEAYIYGVSVYNVDVCVYY